MAKQYPCGLTIGCPGREDQSRVDDGLHGGIHRVEVVATERGVGERAREGRDRDAMKAVQCLVEGGVAVEGLNAPAVADEALSPLLCGAPLPVVLGERRCVVGTGRVATRLPNLWTGSRLTEEGGTAARLHNGTVRMPGGRSEGPRAWVHPAPEATPRPQRWRRRPRLRCCRRGRGLDE